MEGKPVVLHTIWSTIHGRYDFRGGGFSDCEHERSRTARSGMLVFRAVMDCN